VNRVYIQHRIQYLVQHGFAERLQNLNSNWNPEVAEELDGDFQRARKLASKQCKRKPNIALTAQLSSLRIKKNNLVQIISQYKTGYNYSAAIALQARRGTDFLIPSKQDECNVQLKRVHSDIRRLKRQQQRIEET